MGVVGNQKQLEMMMWTCKQLGQVHHKQIRRLLTKEFNKCYELLPFSSYNPFRVKEFLI